MKKLIYIQTKAHNNRAHIIAMICLFMFISCKRLEMFPAPKVEQILIAFTK